jgi:hypothetical protein
MLVDVWPDIERAALSGINDYGDFTNVDGWHIEARNRATWALPDWIRGVYKKLRRKHGNTDQNWMIVFKSDKRGELHEDYAVLPLRLAADLLYVYRYHVARESSN